jgi:flavorubredoxin
MGRAEGTEARADRAARVAAGRRLLRTMNAYLIEDGDDVVVFGTGEKGMAGAIAAAGARLGGIESVVLGHADTDHRVRWGRRSSASGTSGR